MVLHSYPWEHDKKYNPHLGRQDILTGMSLQTNWENVRVWPAAVRHPLRALGAGAGCASGLRALFCVELT